MNYRLYSNLKFIFRIEINRRRHTHIQTDSYIDRQKDRQTDRETDRHADTQIILRIDIKRIFIIQIKK